MMISKQAKLRAKISKDELKTNFHYDPIAGTLFRIYHRKSGKVEYVKVGWSDAISHHIKITYKEAFFYLHRVCWLLATGDWPKGNLDHANRDPSDNRLCNLREAGKSGNQMNVAPCSKSEYKFISKYKGVTYNSKKWVARISYTEADGTQHNLWLGRFLTEEDAAVAYNLAAIEHHGKFAYLNVIEG